MYRRPLRRGGLADGIELARESLRRIGGAMRATPGLLLISLLLGFALWISVTDIENPTRIDVFPAAIPVEAVNVAPQLAVANVLDAVQVTVSAPENRWQDLTSENFRAFVDVNGLEEREQLVPVQVDVLGIGGVRVSRIEPGTVLVNLEPIATKQVPVEARLIGSVPLGFEVVEVAPAEAEVTVSGPSSLVALVEKAAAEVSVTGLTVGLVETAQLVGRGDGGGEIRGVRIDPPSMRVRIEVVRSRLARELPLRATFAGDPASGYRVVGVSVQPSAITVEGPIDVLQSVDTIDLPPVDISGAEATVIRQIAIEPPPDVDFPDALTATVSVQIEVITGTARLAIPIDVLGVPPGRQVELNEPAVVVLLAGDLPTLGALASNDVVATIDLAGVLQGDVDVPVMVTGPAGTRVVSVQPDTVSVTIRSQPSE